MSTVHVSALGDPGDRDAPAGSLPWAKWLVGQIQLRRDECLRDQQALDRLLAKLDKYEAWRVLGYASREDVLASLRSNVVRRPAVADLHDKPVGDAGAVTELTAAKAILGELKAAGVALEAREGNLRLSPASRGDAALLARVKAYKPVILCLLATRPDPAELWRRVIEDVAEKLKLPPDVLEAARHARVKWR